MGVGPRVIEVYDAFSLDGLCYDALDALTASLDIVDQFDALMAEKPDHKMSRVDHVRAVRLIALQECGQLQTYFDPHTDATLADRHKACLKVVNEGADRLIELEVPGEIDNEDDPLVVGLVQELCTFVRSLYTALRVDDAKERASVVKEYCRG